MAKTQVALEITATDNASNSVKGIKTQLKEATAELIAMREKFGDTSAEAIAAAQKVGKLKDAIGDAKSMADAFNPDAKFKAFSGALQGVAGGFAAVQGGMALLGAESEDVNKTLLKVQSALALSEGLNTVMESVDAFKNLGAVMKNIPIVQKAIAAGQKLWNLAMEANPIGLLIAGITALIAAGAALVSWFKSSAAASAANTKAVNDSTAALEKQEKQLARNNFEFERNQNQQLALAKASGMNAKAIRELELKLIDEKIAFQLSNRAIAENTMNKEKNQLASLQAADADDEVIKKQYENYKKAVDGYNQQNAEVQKALDEKVDIQNRHNAEIRQEETDANKKAEDDRKQAADKRKEREKKERDERLAAEKQYQTDLKALQESNYLASIKDDDARAKEKLLLDYQRALAEIQQRNITDAEKANLIKENSIKYQNEVDALDAEIKKKKDEEADKAIQEEVDRLMELNELDLKIKKENIEAHKKLDEEKFNNQMDVLSQTSGILSKFGDVVGKETAVGKGLAVASATIDTYTGAMKAFRATYSPIGPVDVAMRFASVAATIATGIKNVKEILKVKVPGGGGGGSTPSAPSATGVMTAPVAPVLSSTALNQQMVNNLNSATNRSFVLESDISGNQERIQRLNRAARIN